MNLTGTFIDASGGTAGGTVSFTPVAVLTPGGSPVPVMVTNAAGRTVIASSGVTRNITSGSLNVVLAATDTAGLSPSGWAYQVTWQPGGLAPETFTCFLPGSPSSVDFSALVPASVAEALYAYLPTSGGTVSGPIVLSGGLQIPSGASAGDVLTSDSSGNASWSPITAAEIPAATGSATGGVQLNTDLGGTATAPHVVATHLASALPVAQGGTNATTAAAALASLGGAAVAGDIGGTSASPQVTSTHLASALPLAQGGTGSTTRNFSGLLTQTATKTSAYTASAGDFVCVDTTSGAVTITLPNAPADLTVVAVKMTASAATPNAVTIACQGSDVINKTGGSTSLSLSLVEQSAVLQYQASGGIWLKQTGDVPLTQLDGRYSRVFSPLAFGAVGNGTTDDTAALQACAAAAVAVKGVIDLGTYTFKISSPVNITTGFHMKGAGYEGGTIVSSASDIFTFGSSVSYVTFEGCNFTSNSGGGHIWNASNGPSMSFWKILGCVVTQSNAGKCIWYQNGGGWIDCLVDQQCFFSCSGSATVSPWTMINAPGAVNSVKFSRMRCTANGAGVPFFLIDPGYGAHTDTNVGMTASSTAVTDASAVSADLGFFVYSTNFSGGSSKITAVNPGVGYTVATAATATLSGQTCIVGNKGWDEDIVFDHITWEVCTGGAIRMTGTVDVLISMCAHWDTTATSNIYSFTQSNTGYPCRNIVVRGGRAGTVAGGVYDFYADSNTTNVLIDSFGSWGTPPVISSPAGQTTIINNTVAGATSAVPTSIPGTLALGGANGATAASRYAGATAGGAPTGSSNAFLQGDWVIDQTGSIWICTTAGSPGTWAQVGSASGFANANDPMKTGYTATYISPNPVTAGVFGDGANSGTYVKLRSGGYAISNWSVNVGTSSGNISIAAYTDSGTGTSAKPTGGQLATSGAISCPATGYSTVSLGSTITPNLGDWAAMSCDNATATFTSLATGSNTNFCQGIAYVQASAHPLPGTPSSLAADFYNALLMKGS